MRVFVAQSLHVRIHLLYQDILFLLADEIQQDFHGVVQLHFPILDRAITWHSRIRVRIDMFWGRMTERSVYIAK